MKATRAVAHHVWSAGPADARNNVTDVFTPPATAEGETRWVYGWSLVAVEPAAPGRSRQVRVVELLCPPDFTPAQRDLIALPARPSGLFEVTEIDDANTGFGWEPGSVVTLKEVLG